MYPVYALREFEPCNALPIPFRHLKHVRVKEYELKCYSFYEMIRGLPQYKYMCSLLLFNMKFERKVFGGILCICV